LSTSSTGGVVSASALRGSMSSRGATRRCFSRCSEKHLHRYLVEFDFRNFNRSKLGIEDQERATEVSQFEFL
jgi:hypothetical protein